MNILKKPKKQTIVKDVLYAIGLFFTFKIASYLGSVAYLYPYFDSDITSSLIIITFCYCVFGFLFGVIITESGLKSMGYIQNTLLGGMVLFLMYIIPFKTTFTHDTADKAYQHILKKMELDQDKSKIAQTNKDIDEIFESYKKREISKLPYFESKIDDVLKIKDDEFAQLIVNVRVLNNEAIINLYNKSLEDKRISINEQKEIIKLIISEEIK